MYNTAIQSREAVTTMNIVEKIISENLGTKTLDRAYSGTFSAVGALHREAREMDSAAPSNDNSVTLEDFGFKKSVPALVQNTLTNRGVVPNHEKATYYTIDARPLALAEKIKTSLLPAFKGATYGVMAAAVTTQMALNSGAPTLGLVAAGAVALAVGHEAYKNLKQAYAAVSAETLAVGFKVYNEYKDVYAEPRTAQETLKFIGQRDLIPVLR